MPARAAERTSAAMLPDAAAGCVIVGARTPAASILLNCFPCSCAGNELQRIVVANAVKKA